MLPDYIIINNNNCVGASKINKKKKQQKAKKKTFNLTKIYKTTTKKFQSHLYYAY